MKTTLCDTNIHGLVFVDKPPGLTSFDVVRKIKPLVAPLKIGHGGTLDPMARGMLPILIGQGTKWMESLLALPKTYRFVMRLGQETDTDDILGKVEVEKPYDHVCENQLISAMKHFEGTIDQTPPMYSALRHKGQRLYQLARKGKIIPRQKRKITIYNFRLLYTNLPQVELLIECSRGTYVRTICRDLGRMVKTVGCMESLVRERIGCFTLNEAVSLMELLSQGLEGIKKHLIQKKTWDPSECL